MVKKNKKLPKVKSEIQSSTADKDQTSADIVKKSREAADVSQSSAEIITSVMTQSATKAQRKIADQTAIKQGNKVGINQSESKRAKLAEKILNQQQEELKLNKLNTKIERLIVRGRFKEAAEVKSFLDGRIQKTKELEEREEALAKLKEETFGNLAKTALGPLGGIMSATSDIVGNIKDQFLAFKEIGSRLFGGIMKGFSAIGSVFGKKSKSKEEEIADDQLTVLQKISKQFKTFFNKDKRSKAEEIAESGKVLLGSKKTGKNNKKFNLSGMFGNLVEKAKGFLIAIGSGLLAAGVVLLKGLGRIITKIFPITALAISIGAFIMGAFNSFMDSNAGSLIGRITEGLLGGLASVIDFLTFGLINKEKFMSLVNPAIEFMDGIGIWLSEKISSIKNAFVAIWDKIGDGFNSAGSFISGIITKMVNVVKNFYGTIWNGILDTLSFVLRKIPGLGKAADKVENLKVNLSSSKATATSKTVSLASKSLANETVRTQSTPALINAPQNANIVNNNNTTLPALPNITTRTAAARAWF